jgi:hypothetical protein
MDRLRIEGFAIVSANGMIAASDGYMPNTLKFDCDQNFLCRSLDDATLLVHGRKSHEGQENSCNRRRLLLTRCIETFSLEPVEPNVWYWNPDITPFDDACKAIGVESGLVAILGGTAAYDMFLPRYAAFHLVRAGKVRLPDGVPVLSGVCSIRKPGDVLAKAGLSLTDEETLDKTHDVVRQNWARTAKYSANVAPEKAQMHRATAPAAV